MNLTVQFRLINFAKSSGIGIRIPQSSGAVARQCSVKDDSSGRALLPVGTGPPTSPANRRYHRGRQSAIAGCYGSPGRAALALDRGYCPNPALRNSHRPV